MRVYEYMANANVYSVPFDWDAENRTIDYVRAITETYFDTVQRVGNQWQPTFHGRVNRKEKLADLGVLVGGEDVVFSQKAVDVLGHLIAQSVELLPYDTEVGVYYLVNVLDEGEYLDREHTDCDELLPSGLCFGINAYVFRPEAIADRHIFRIPDMPVTRFVSGTFIERCREHGLVGIHLDDQKSLIWTSER